jgi:TRAP-type uncharacterized transport system fused permease subunit
MSGLGVKVPAAIEQLSGGNLMLALIISMLVSILLGLGMSTSAAYVLVAMMGAPMLVRMGVDLLSAHLFTFYFACFSVLTPPVGPAALVACSLARSPYLQTGVESMKAALAGFILPFLFIFSPLVLLQPHNMTAEAVKLGIGLLAILSAQVSITEQWLIACRGLERALYALSSIALFAFLPTGESSFAAGGGILFLLLTIRQVREILLKRGTHDP